MAFNALGLPLEYCSPTYRDELARKKKAGPSTSTSTSPTPTPTPLWTPSHPENTPISQYRSHINAKFSPSPTLTNSHDLHTWTVRNPHAFWTDLYSYCDIIPALPADTSLAYDPATKLRDIPVFFPGRELNYAENVLSSNVVSNTSNTSNTTNDINTNTFNTNTNTSRRNPPPTASSKVALIGLRENRLDQPEEITWWELAELVRMTRSAMVRQGLRKGDVVAALMANSVWIVVLFLATASIGAIFTSVSPDMGVQGCTARFAQVTPKLLFADIDLAVRGVRRSMLGKVQNILRSLTSTSTSTSTSTTPTSLSLPPPPRLIFVPTCPRPHLAANIEYIRPLGGAEALHSFLQASHASDAMTYTRVPTNHPLVIVYSSGTTGEPKCIASPHTSILNYKKIALLHNSLTALDTVFQYSSTSWILWNVMNGHLSVGATVICYDGGALYPNPSTLLNICSKFKATYWGTSPRYLLELEQSGIKPSDYDLTSLKLVTTTGATLTGEQFTWFYCHDNFPRRIHLSSVAGGTEIASSWIATDPAGPVYANEMQMWALGHDCDILDSESQTGESIALTGRPGELVCRAPFPSMPCRFWGDERNKKYHAAYFEKFPIPIPIPMGPKPKSNPAETATQHDYLDVSAQHDFITMNPLTRGVQILGRSDGVLNPSGIRFGSSEIYNIVQGPTFDSLLADTLCVGRRRQADQDETVFLFVVMAPGQEDKFGEDLVRKIKESIATALSPRHVPKFVKKVSEIPYTVNGKKVEIAVKKVISGQKVKVSSTVVNPGCLKEYERYVGLEREGTNGRSRL